METVNLEHLFEQAKRSFYNISFDPEGRAKRLLDSLSKELGDDMQQFREAANGRLSAPEMQAVFDRYQTKYEEKIKTWLSSQSNTASAAIVGPAKFPYERMKKLEQWAENKYDDFRNWRERAIKVIIKSIKPPVNELEDAQKRLEDQQEKHRIMIAANKIIRKGGPNVREDLIQLGIKPDELEEILKPMYNLKPGYGGYTLQLSGAKIKKLIQRVATLEAKKSLSQNVGKQIIDVNGHKLIINYEADRVQIGFAEKPDKEVTRLLSKRQFHYKPSEKLWQRKLTNNAIDESKTILSNLPGKKR